jgi:hypothetical protein
MTGCILGSQYIPSVEYFAHWKWHGQVIIEANEHYQKRTWRNKTAILGPEKPQHLTVPLQKGKHQQMMIRDVRIAYDEPWKKNHLNSIKTAYGKTAFFDEVLPVLEAFYLPSYETLWDLNAAGISFILDLLGGKSRYDLSEDFFLQYQTDAEDLRSGVPGGISKLSLALMPVYPQVQRLQKTHQPNLCILDALCHLGPGTGDYLSRYAYKLYEKK